MGIEFLGIDDRPLAMTQRLSDPKGEDDQGQPLVILRRNREGTVLDSLNAATQTLTIRSIV
jgi:hypothetical protein